MKRIKTQEREQLIELGLRGSRKDTIKRTGGRISEELEEKDLLLGDCKEEGRETRETHIVQTRGQGPTEVQPTALSFFRGKEGGYRVGIGDYKVNREELDEFENT